MIELNEKYVILILDITIRLNTKKIYTSIHFFTSTNITKQLYHTSNLYASVIQQFLTAISWKLSSNKIKLSLMNPINKAFFNDVFPETNGENSFSSFDDKIPNKTAK